MFIMDFKSKRSLALLFCLVLILTLGLSLVHAQTASSSSGSVSQTLDSAGLGAAGQLATQQNLDKVNSAANKVSSTVSSVNLNNWQSLADAFKQKLLSSQFVSPIDKFFQAISPVFQVLFGLPYSFSLKFLFITIIWIYLLFQFKKVLNFTIFSKKGVCWLISIGLLILFAQTGILSAISGFLSGLVMAPKTPWIGILIFIGIIVAMVLLGGGLTLMTRFSKKARKALAEAEADVNRNILDSYVKGIIK